MDKNIAPIIIGLAAAGIIAVLGMALWFLAIPSAPPSPDGEGNTPLAAFPEEQEATFLSVPQLFAKEMTARAVQKIGQPIEGFDAFLLMGAYPQLEESDFHNVETAEGKYAYGTSLVWARTKEQPITTVEKMISEKGYETLLQNVSARLNMPAATQGNATAIIDAISK